MGFPKGGFSMESALTATAFNNDTSVFRNNLVHALVDAYKVDASAAGVITAAAVRTKAEANGSITYTNAADIMLTAPFNVTAPNYHANDRFTSINRRKLYRYGCILYTSNIPWGIWYHQLDIRMGKLYTTNQYILVKLIHTRICCAIVAVA
jgi:hypothetical protein